MARLSVVSLFLSGISASAIACAVSPEPPGDETVSESTSSASSKSGYADFYPPCSTFCMGLPDGTPTACHVVHGEPTCLPQEDCRGLVGGCASFIRRQDGHVFVCADPSPGDGDASAAHLCLREDDVPCVPASCTGRCGTIDDGCGTLRACGACPSAPPPPVVVRLRVGNGCRLSVEGGTHVGVSPGQLVTYANDPESAYAIELEEMSDPATRAGLAPGASITRSAAACKVPRRTGWARVAAPRLRFACARASLTFECVP